MILTQKEMIKPDKYPCGCHVTVQNDEIERKDPGHIMPDLFEPTVFSDRGFKNGILCDYIYCKKHMCYWGERPYKRL